MGIFPLGWVLKELQGMIWEVIGKKHTLSFGIPWALSTAQLATQSKFLIVSRRLDLLLSGGHPPVQGRRDKQAAAHS